MKTNFRYLVFLALMVVAYFGTCLTPRSAAAPAQNLPSPACVSECSYLLYQCLANGEKNNDHACISVYRHCLAQCGKH